MEWWTSVILDIMAARELIVLGTASMAPTRDRAHSSYALRWDDQLVLFDPGEGTQRGFLQAGIAVSKLTAVCITHFHGDHCLGLPGVIGRRSLDVETMQTDLPTLPVFHPADGTEYFEHLRRCSKYDPMDVVESRPVATGGFVAELGPFRLSAAPLRHRDTTFGYRIDEADGTGVDPVRLAELGIAGPDIGRLIEQGWLDTDAGRVTREDVSVPKPGQSMAFVMDTLPCEGALELASGVDLLVCESTFLHTEVELARSYMHMTARQAGELATEAGARRVVLSHFSARYESGTVFADEASRYHDDVIAASDLAVIEVPRRAS